MFRYVIDERPEGCGFERKLAIAADYSLDLLFGKLVFQPSDCFRSSDFQNASDRVFRVGVGVKYFDVYIPKKTGVSFLESCS